MALLVPGLLFAVSADWLVPLWLLGMGLALGSAVLGVAWLISRLVSPRFGRAVDEIVQEGPLVPLGVLVVLLVGTAACLTPITPYGLFWRSLVRTPITLGEVRQEFQLEPSEARKQVPFNMRRAELQSLSFTSDQDVLVVPDMENPLAQEGRIADEGFSLREVAPGRPQTWVRQPRVKPPVATDVENLFLTNRTDKPAKITVAYRSGLVTPEVLLIPRAALALILFVSGYVLLRWMFPKMGAIAVATAREGVAQPVFMVVLFVGMILLILFPILPYNTFGEDIKIFKSASLVVTMILGIVVALWTASVSISEEIEGRTALTVLSKPIGRKQFVLGKFAGVLLPVLLLFMILGTTTLALTSYKTLYDARESSMQDIGWRECYGEMCSIFPNLVLVFLETCVLTSISVAISTRLPMLPNLLICMSIYVIGNLLPQLVQSNLGKFPIVEFMAQFLALVFPVLSHFDINVPTAAGKNLSLAYLGWASAYAALYCTFSMLVALFLFEDRDLG